LGSDRLEWGHTPAADPPDEEPGISIFGSTQGLKASQVRQLQRLLRRRILAERIVTHELARELCALSAETGRRVGVLVDRRGEVTDAGVGDARVLHLPDWGRMRAGRGRLRGLRLVHTHLGDEPLTPDDLTDLALLRLDATVAICTRPDGTPGLVHAAALLPANAAGDPIERFAPIAPGAFDLDFQDWIRAREEEFSRTTVARAVGDGERAILVCVTSGKRRDEHEMQLAELRELARTAGVEVVDVVSQHRERVDPRTVIGSGKLQDLMVRALWSDADLVIFDQNLSPVQARNLGERLELRVIDRTQLILDIFAQRASTRDGKLQVELAQLRYRLPRLAQRDGSLSRLAGGIGGRGPGETKLEIDRRRVRERIARLERELAKLQRDREGRRKRRGRQALPVLSIVGYTNAGKSTLLRALTKSDVLIEDRLFATLDPSSRRLRFPRERDVIVTDTVGFIRDLPPDLVTAFRATLEELREADLFLHVVDAGSPDLERRIAAVHQVIGKLGLDGTPEILVLNQIDRLPPDVWRSLALRHHAVAVSALRGEGLEALLARVADALWREDIPADRRLRLEALQGEGTHG
jgi:GTP-binding protein HflX